MLSRRLDSIVAMLTINVVFNQRRTFIQLFYIKTTPFIRFKNRLETLKLLDLEVHECYLGVKGEVEGEGRLIRSFFNWLNILPVAGRYIKYKGGLFSKPFLCTRLALIEFNL